MKGEFEPSQLTIIYAEDEFVFREITVPAIIKAGITRDNLHIAEDGLAALEHLERLQTEPAAPLVMLLDVRMPSMDGIQCAKKVQELVQANSLRRIPFLVCCSAAIRQVSFEDELGIFQITLPKPFGSKEVDMCIGKVREWWAKASQSSSAGAAGGDSVGRRESAVEIKCLDLMIADDEPICRMAVTASLQQAGAGADAIREVEDDEELVEAIDASKADAPVVIFLGNPHWMATLSEKLESVKNKPFVICTSVDSDRVQGQYNAHLPQQFTQADVKAVLEQCCNWFNSA
mmetsp:Transcript_8857/g.24819  ORF Transcript_8857/g.24819 Transcript_8857/m.24819 type:complete len:289 (+) Transcript_8857:65-931(+)